MELIFKALADSRRRRIMDILKTKPGITLQDLCTNFEISRFAVMKHLKILEEANLVVHRWEGRFKHFYLNTIPIQMIYDRWLSEFTRVWSPQLTQLKYTLEKENVMSDFQDKQIYVLYIRTTPEKLWEALTSPAVSEQYFFNTRVRSDFKAGSDIHYEMDNSDGTKRIPVKGKVQEVVPQKKLVHTFRHDFGEEKKGYSRESRVSYEIESMGELVKLTLVHDDFRGDEETFRSTSSGWPMILNGLKTVLETGIPLKFPDES